MSNTFLTPNIVANEALAVLLNSLVMANLVHRDYSNEFVNVGDTITIRKPAKFVAQNFTGTTEDQDATEGSVDVKMDRFRDITVPVTSREMTLNINDFSSQIITPAMQAIAQAVDEDLAAVALQKAGFTINGNTTKPLDDLAQADKNFNIRKVPKAMRRAVLNPTHQYRYISGDLSNAAYANSTDALREAALGRLYGFDTFMDQNMPSSGNAGTATAFKVTAVKGESKVALSSVTAASATIKNGDYFIIDGYLYAFTEDKTAASGAIGTININQKIHKSFTETEAVVIRNPESAVFHRNGIALVTRNLELPMGANNAAYASADGIGVRVVYDYDIKTKTDRVSFDLIYGIKELDTNMIGKIAG